MKQLEQIQQKMDLLMEKNGYVLAKKVVGGRSGVLIYERGKWFFQVGLDAYYGEFETNLVPKNAEEILEQVGYSLDWVLEYINIKPHPLLVQGMIIHSEEDLKADLVIVSEALESHVFPLLQRADKDLEADLLKFAKKKNIEYNAQFKRK